jgi:hypothetical protein
MSEDHPNINEMRQSVLEGITNDDVAIIDTAASIWNDYTLGLTLSDFDVNNPDHLKINSELAAKFINAYIKNGFVITDDLLQNNTNWYRLLFRIILLLPANNKQRDMLDTHLFTNSNLWNNIFGRNFREDFKDIYANDFTSDYQTLTNTKFDLTDFDKQTKKYAKYKIIQEALESNDIFNIKNEPIEEFIVLQTTDNIDKYLKVLSGIFNEKTEPIAKELKQKIINTITSELDTFIFDYSTKANFDSSTISYYSKFIGTALFNAYIVSYSPTLFKKFRDKAAASLKDGVNKIIEDRLKKTITKYADAHAKYMTDNALLINNVKTIVDEIKTTDPEYEKIKSELTLSTKLMSKMQTDYSRIMQFKPILDGTGNILYDISGVKQYIKDNVEVLQKYVKKLSETESFLKDKKLNKDIKKDHQFSLDIKLLTNVLNNQEIKYTSKMTAPNAGGELYFPIINDLHKNTILDNPTKDPSYIYTQFTSIPSFKSLISRTSRGYPFESENEFDEYSKTYDKKKDKNAIRNIEVVLETFFGDNAPFFIGSERYTVFSYEWDQEIEQILKNGKKETYGDDGPETLINVNQPPVTTTAQSQSTTITQSNLKMPVFTNKSELNEVGDKLDASLLTPVIPNVFDNELNEVEHKDDSQPNLTPVVPNVFDNEINEVEHKDDSQPNLTPVIPNVFDNEINEVEHKSDSQPTLTPVVPNVFDNELNEVESKSDSQPTLTPVVPNVFDNELNEVESKSDSQSSLTPIIPATFNNEMNEVNSKSDEQTPSSNPLPDENAIETGIVDNFTKIKYVDKNKFIVAAKEELKKDLDQEMKSVIMSLIPSDQFGGDVDPSDINLIFDQPDGNDHYDDKSYRIIVRIYAILKILENEKRPSIIDFESIYKALKEINTQYNDAEMAYYKKGGQVGGGTTLYIDIGEEIRSYADQLQEQKNEIKKQQDEEIALIAKKEEDPLKADIITVVNWKYTITVQLYLYPGDSIPLSAMASLKCSKQRDKIYTIWKNNNILGMFKNTTVKNKQLGDKKEKKKYALVGPYFPINTNNGTLKKKPDEAKVVQ